MTTVKDNNPRVQYTASAGQTVFSAPFLYLSQDDLRVYKRASGSTANDTTDILIITTNYSVTGVGNDDGGTIVLTSGATAGDILTIERDMSQVRLTNLTTNGELKSADLNLEFNRQVLMSQQNESTDGNRNPIYPRSAVIADKDRILPILGSKQRWVMNTANNAMTAVTDESTSADLLRTELAKQTTGTDGALLVGYYDAVLASGRTIKTKLDTIDTNKTALASQTSGSDGALLVGYYDSVAVAGRTVHSKLDTIDANKAALALQTSGTDGALLVGYYDSVLASGRTIKSKLDTIDTNKTNLASQASGSDGAMLVGYYDSVAVAGTTVKAILDSLNTKVPRNEKNLIIAGDFSLAPWQMGTSFTSPSTGSYVSDMYRYFKVGSMNFNIARTADAPTPAQALVFSSHCLHMVVTVTDGSIAATDRANIMYLMEGIDFTRVAQRIFTYSFWAKYTKTGIYCLSFQNTAQDRSYIAEYTINASDTWEKVAVSVAASPVAGTWNYTNGIGLRISFVFAAGTALHTTANAWQTGTFYSTVNQVNGVDSTANNFKIDLVQLEEGSFATSFELKTKAEELFNCRKYLFKTYDDGVNPGTATTTGAITTVAAKTIASFRQMQRIIPVAMRTIGSSTWYSTTGVSGKIRDCTASADLSVSSVSSMGQSSTGYPVIGTTVTDQHETEAHLVLDSRL